MEKMTISEAINRFMKLPEQTDRDQVLAITRRNKEIMVVMSWELYEGLLETIEILSDPELMSDLGKSMADLKAGRVYTLSEASERLRT